MPTGLGGEQLWLCPSLDNSADDISGNGNNGTYVGGMGTVADTSNGGSLAYEFDGVDDRIDCPSGTLGGSSLFSMSCWAYVDSHDATFGEGFMGQWENNISSNRVGIIYSDPSSSYKGLVTTNTGSHTSSAAGTSPPIGSWHHLACVVSGSEVTLYVDGVSQGSTAYTGVTNLTPTNAFEIGRYFGSGGQSNRHCLDGKMDDIRVFHRILGTSEIAHLASSRGVQGSPYTETGLGDEWLWCCPSLDDSADDISGNTNHGTYVGGLSTTADTGAGGSRAYDIDAFTKGVQLDQDILLNETAYSYSCWFKPNGTSTGGSDRRIFGAYNSSNVNANILFSQNNGILRMLAISDSATTYVKSFTTSLNADQWYHLCVVVYDGSQGYYAGFIDGIPFTFFEYLGSTKDTGRTGLEFNIGGGTNSGFNKGADGLIDDVRLFKRALSDSEVEHLSESRGVQDAPSFRRVAVRKDLSYVTDTELFSACQPNSSSGQPPFTSEYTSAQGFGFVSGTYSTSTFRNRNSSNAPQLAGMFFNSGSAVFRMDLPRGAGKYKVYFAGVDQASGQATGWRFKDGDAGTEFATLSQTTTTTQYVDITNTRQLVSGFDYANENFVEHTFTNGHFTINRDTSLAGGNGVISAVWVEYVEDTPPPATGFYNPFINKTFNPNYTRRIG